MKSIKSRKSMKLSQANKIKLTKSCAHRVKFLCIYSVV